MADETRSFLKGKNWTTTQTNVQDRISNVAEEKAWLESDLIVYHTPVWWFGTPYPLKEYIDNVFEYNVFYGPSSGAEYGTKGLMKGKKYIFVVTFNAAEVAFEKQNFFQGKSVDDVFLGFHLAQKYIGLEHAGTYTVYDVIHGDKTHVKNDYKAFLEKLSL